MDEELQNAQRISVDAMCRREYKVQLTSASTYALMPWSVHRARARAHVCTKRTANASSPSPSPPNNRRGTIIPLLHTDPQDSPLHTQAIPRPRNATPGLFTQPPDSYSMASVCLNLALLRNPSHPYPHMLTASSKLPTSRAPTPATTSPMAAPPRAPCLALSRWTPTAAA